MGSVEMAVLIVVTGVPVVVLTLRHQQRMALIIRQNSGESDQTRAQIVRLDHEVQKLRARQAEVIVRMDDASEVQRRVEC